MLRGARFWTAFLILAIALVGVGIGGILGPVVDINVGNNPEVFLSPEEGDSFNIFVSINSLGPFLKVLLGILIFAFVVLVIALGLVLWYTHKVGGHISELANGSVYNTDFSDYNNDIKAEDWDV